MKRIINFKLSTLTILFIASLFMSSCIKDYRDGETNFSNLQPTVSIVEGGLAQFNSESLVYPNTDVSDTTIFRVDYAATSVAPTNETVTLSIDTALVAAYNSANGLTGTSSAYQVMPDSLYSYSTTSATIAAGQSYSPAIPFVIFPDKITDPTVSYMLPITISGAPNGSTISGNYGTIYYHVIGNPIAGTYEDAEWLRWNESDTSGAPSYDFTYADLGDVTFAPLSSTEIAVQSNANGATYDISFTNNGGVLSNFSTTIDPASYANFGLAQITAAPVMEIADPVNGIYRITFGYNNTSVPPGARVIRETFIKE